MASDATATEASAKSGTSESSEATAKHSAADPVSTALTLLEQALAGALAGAPSATPAATGSTAAASGASTQALTSDGGSRGRSAAGKSTSTVLATLLTQNLATDLKAGTTTAAPTDSSSAGATPALAATAALTAAQSMAASHVGSSQARSDSATTALSSPVGSDAWTDELGARLTWMAHQGIDSACLQLSPEHLGPLQVTISVHNGQASVWFGAAQPDTRTALQQSLPQLRQLFANQGLTLADAGVSRESPQGQSRQSAVRPSAGISGVAAVSVDSSASRGSVAGGLGLVDTYA